MTKPLTHIVFTRNRPLQLAGFLESFLRHMGPVVETIHILYKKDLFASEYERVFREFPQCRVVEEADFHRDFMSIFGQVRTEYIAFSTDDVVYFDVVDFSLIERAFAERADLLAFTLKLGPEHYADGKEPIINDSVAGQPVYKVDWTKATDPASSYPFELNSTIYRTAFVRELLDDISRQRPRLKRLLAPGSLALKLAGLFVKRKRILRAINTFHCPNTLEGFGYLWCKKHKRRLAPFLYFQRICATTLQVNRVNTVVANPVYGGQDLSVEILNEKFRQGYRLDTRYLETHKPTFVRVGQEYVRLRKDNGATAAGS
jgi:hypothetical protein